MNIGRVVGTVVATRKDETLMGFKLLIAQPLDLQLSPQGTPKVMVDTVGAGIGELVLYVAGSAARNAACRKEGAIDAAVVGIIDEMHVDPLWPTSKSDDAEGEEHIE